MGDVQERRVQEPYACHCTCISPMACGMRLIYAIVCDFCARRLFTRDIIALHVFTLFSASPISELSVPYWHYAFCD